ncbi:MAG TPA: hypothetical protein VHZ02_04585 [Acidimicrobiales bacterium]|nr:hypothetical protein [Acidimicrobiales bacterium]
MAGAALGGGSTAEAVGGTPTLPLASGVSTPSQSSVSLPMGHLDDPDNTFWELFMRSTGSASWTLDTPPGVADNGGLAVAAPSSGPVTVGFLPSQLLRFSPLARTADGGKTWSSGEIPAALIAAPDALSGGSPGPTTALVAGSGQTVLSSSDLSGWHAVVTTKTLAKSAENCGVQRITAVASDGAFPILGVQCRREGRIGVLFPGGNTTASSGGNTTWTSGGPLLNGGSPGVATVLRLEATPGASTGSTGGLNGLATVRSGRSSSLVAFWTSDPGSAWTQSRRLVLPAGWTVLATSTGGGSTGRGITVLLDSGVRRRIVSVSGPGSSWVSAPAAPSGTEAAVTVGSDVEAFAVDKSRLTIWALGSTTGWSRVQTSTVPVPYGSSG